MRIVNKRFKIVGELENIVNHETYKVEDLKDNRIKRLTLYEQEKDRKTIEYLKENLLEFTNINHRLILSSENFHIVETINGEETKNKLYYLIHDLKEGELLRLNSIELSKEEKLYILLELFNIIDYLHFRGCIYKYLSPNNIFIDDNKNIELRDMGFVSEQNAGTSYQTITEYFIAPELYLDTELLDCKSDYFSIGVMIKYLFLKDYKKTNISKNDFINSLKFTSEEKVFIIKMIEDLTEENNNIRNVSLRDLIEEVKKVFDIEYEVDLRKERNKINKETALKGRKEHINKLVKNDDILYKNNKVYDGVLIAGQKGYGKTKILRELDFVFRLRKRQIINIKMSHEEDGQSNIKKLIEATTVFAPEELIDKYNLEFGGLLSSIIKENKETYFKDFKTKHRLFNRITNYLLELSKKQILYVMIDDIQNADEDFLLLLNHLMENLKNRRIVFIFTYLELSAKVNPELKGNLDKWKKDEAILKIRLKKLEKVHFKRIIEAKLGFSKRHIKIIDFLYENSEGNLKKTNNIINNLYNTNKLFMTDEGYWDIFLDNYEETFIYSDIHDILKKQLEKISKKAYIFLRKSSIFN